MPNITRKDGERFVIPKYRDTLRTQKGGLLKRQVLLLSKSYGEYIAIQKKGLDQFEVAFSEGPGVLLGETVWEYFKRPQDLIYCEPLPDNPLEAILIVVKSGSVYMEGIFHMDSIVEELLILKTFTNKFDIFIHGNVPLGRTSAEGKFSLDAAAVNSFVVLDEPAFPLLPVLKSLQLQTVEAGLSKYGIGAFPVKRLVMLGILLAAGSLFWLFFMKEPPPPPVVNTVNPYQSYIDQLRSPSPADQIIGVGRTFALLLTIPGWYPDAVDYLPGRLNVSVKSLGAKTKVLFEWAAKNHAQVLVATDGFHLNIPLLFSNRLAPNVNSIPVMNNTMGTLIDRLASVLPGNVLAIGQSTNKRVFSELSLIVSFRKISPSVLCLIGEQFKDLALVLSKMNVTVMNGSVTGSMTLTALGT